MSVKIISPLLYRHSDNQTIEVTGKTIGECLNNLLEKYPDLRGLLLSEKGSLHDYLYLYVNKEGITDNIMKKPVKAGDEIHVIVLIEGG